ncbi:MAG: periplasmic heavy metal sensor [Candidatus Eremiobacteraeota bacterium]|nr:periplasmic heavy metal sensor [Candidatus Eremiobacteraeota bacterium]
MKRLILAVCLSVLLWAILPGLIFAQKPPGEIAPPAMERPGAKKFFNRDRDYLKLSPEQEAAIRKIREKYLIKREDIFLDIQVARLEMIKLLRKEPPDKSAIKKKIEELISLEKKRNFLLLDEFYEIRKNLDANQARLFTRILIREMSRKR